jgi:hypothetical protein
LRAADGGRVDPPAYEGQDRDTGVLNQQCIASYSVMLANVVGEVVASMDLGLATGHPPPPPADLEGRGLLVRSDDVVTLPPSLQCRDRHPVV